MRVAVASTDGSRVDAHFGQATRFEIWELTGGELTGGPPRRLEVRRNAPACGVTEWKGGVDPMEASAALVADCQAVLVAQIGDCGVARLSERGILAFETDDTVEFALQQLAESPHVLAAEPPA